MVVVIRVFFRQSFGTSGPYDTISPTVRILLPSSTRGPRRPCPEARRLPTGDVRPTVPPPGHGRTGSPPPLPMGVRVSAARVRPGGVGREDTKPLEADSVVRAGHVHRPHARRHPPECRHARQAFSCLGPSRGWLWAACQALHGPRGFGARPALRRGGGRRGRGGGSAAGVRRWSRPPGAGG